MLVTQAHIFYLGMVQGVGFRYTVHRLAHGLKLKGWVRNLSDGQVEILVEGPKEKIEQLLGNIERHFDAYIKEKQVSYQEKNSEFNEFQILL